MRCSEGRGASEELYSITVILSAVMSMPTTVQVSEKTLQMLNALKREMKARSHDEVIKSLISKRRKIPNSMFGSNRRLQPFSREGEGESHEL
jgi:predicted CopG family antitoxin